MCACFDIEYILSDMTYCFYGSSDTSQDRIAEGYKLCGIFELLKVFVSQVQDRPNETYYIDYVASKSQWVSNVADLGVVGLHHSTEQCTVYAESRRQQTSRFDAGRLDCGVGPRHHPAHYAVLMMFCLK